MKDQVGFPCTITTGFPLAFVQVVAVPAPQSDEMRIVIVELFEPGGEASAGQSEC